MSEAWNLKFSSIWGLHNSLTFEFWSFWTFKPSDTQMPKASNFKSLDPRNLQFSNFQNFKLPNFQTFKHSDFQSFHLKIPLLLEFTIP